VLFDIFVAFVLYIFDFKKALKVGQAISTGSGGSDKILQIAHPSLAKVVFLVRLRMNKFALQNNDQARPNLRKA
jgi:hypothetical protein